jgi:hypothetical protein
MHQLKGGNSCFPGTFNLQVRFGSGRTWSFLVGAGLAPSTRRNRCFKWVRFGREWFVRGLSRGRNGPLKRTKTKTSLKVPIFVLLMIRANEYFR